jgi:hypothetical protein
MAWEHVGGRPPFHDTEAPMAVLMRHIREEIPQVDQINATAEMIESSTPERVGVTRREFRATSARYLETLVASGEFPNLKRIGPSAYLASDTTGLAFETGLRWLLDGIAAGLGL